MPEPKIALILPVLNCLAYTKKFLETSWDRYHVKLIAINNGSNDGTAELFDKIKDCKNTHVFNFTENRGVSGAWNFGIYHAINKLNCDKFLICNNDEIINPEAIEILSQALDGDNIVMATATDISGKVIVAEDVLTAEIPEKEELTENPDFSCFMIKTETIEKIGYFDEKFYPAYFEDNDYHHRIKLAGLLAVKSSKALYYHFGSRTKQQGGQIAMFVNDGYLNNREYYRMKWGGLPGEETYLTPFNKK